MRYIVDHDLHIHSNLSTCSRCPEQTPERIAQYAVDMGLKTICITDHFWDEKVPGASAWYAPQNFPHISLCKPLPQPQGVQFLFGCETELPANGIPALAKDHFDLFDFVIIPPNHMHMDGLVRPAGIDTPQKMARLLEDRLENLIMQDLPFEKIGIAHLTCKVMFPEGCASDVAVELDETRLLRIFEGYAKAGCGIELQAFSFLEWDTRREDCLRIYRIAKAAGCKFYLGSDAHHPDWMEAVPDRLPKVIDALGLTESDRYLLPALVHGSHHA